MSIEVKDLGKNQVEFSCSISAEKFAEATQKAYTKGVKNIAIHGFRKGKAPRSIIEKMYGEEVFFEDAINDLLPETYDNAVKEANLDVVSQPDIEDLKATKEDGVTFIAKVYIRPVAVLEDYKGIAGKKIVYNVTDKIIASQLEEIRERNSRIVSVEDRGIENDDVVNIDFEGYIDDTLFEGGSAQGFDLTIGSGEFIPGFEEQLIGKGTNDDVEVDVAFPKDYPTEDLKGKNAKFKVKINKVTAKELPELDDDFAKDVSEFDTLEEYKADISKKTQEKMNERSEVEFENDIVEAISNKVEIDIPEPMISERIELLAKDFETSMSQQGISRELYLQYRGVEEREYLDQFRHNAEMQVKSMLVLEAVARQENICVSEDELDQELDKISTHYGIEKEKILTMIDKSNIEKDVLIRKAVDFVKENAVCQEISEEEAKAEIEAETAEETQEEAPKKAATKKTTRKKKTEE